MGRRLAVYSPIAVATAGQARSSTPSSRRRYTVVTANELWSADARAALSAQPLYLVRACRRERDLAQAPPPIAPTIKTSCPERATGRDLPTGPGHVLPDAPMRRARVHSTRSRGEHALQLAHGVPRFLQRPSYRAPVEMNSARCVDGHCAHRSNTCEHFGAEPTEQVLSCGRGAMVAEQLIQAEEIGDVDEGLNGPQLRNIPHNFRRASRYRSRQAQQLFNDVPIAPRFPLTPINCGHAPADCVFEVGPPMIERSFQSLGLEGEFAGGIVDRCDQLPKVFSDKPRELEVRRVSRS